MKIYVYAHVDFSNGYLSILDFIDFYFIILSRPIEALYADPVWRRFNYIYMLILLREAVKRQQWWPVSHTTTECTHTTL